jgi:NAD(P)-dependent dehydrogenase (short-subunit alcohol dehydrogenase family)
LALADAGADVALIGRSEAHLEYVAGAIRQRGRYAAWTAADVADWDAVSDAVAEINDSLGSIDILINNAAVEGVTARLETLDSEEWAAELAINLNGPFYCVRAVAPAMRARGWGRILNVTSGAGTKPVASKAAYSVAKAGLNMLTQALASELNGSGVAVIAVSPGMLDTEMQERMRNTAASDMEMFRRAYSSGWLRPPEEAAALLRWLCGPEGEAYAGQIVSVNTPEIRARAGLPALAR